MRSNSPEAREETNEGDFKAKLVAQKESAGRMELGRTVGAFYDNSGCRAVAESAGLIEKEKVVRKVVLDAASSNDLR